MDAIQETLGKALLVLVGLAIVLSAIVLVLFEADLILRLGGKLARQLGPGGSDPAGSKTPTENQDRTACWREDRGNP